MCTLFETVMPLEKFNGVTAQLPDQAEGRRWDCPHVIPGDLITGVQCLPMMADATGTRDSWAPQLVQTGGTTDAAYYDAAMPHYQIVTVSPFEAKSPQPAAPHLDFIGTTARGGINGANNTTGRPLMRPGVWYPLLLKVGGQGASLWISTTVPNGVPPSFNNNEPSGIMFRVIRPSLQPDLAKLRRPDPCEPNKPTRAQTLKVSR